MEIIKNELKKQINNNRKVIKEYQLIIVDKETHAKRKDFLKQEIKRLKKITTIKINRLLKI